MIVEEDARQIDWFRYTIFAIYTQCWTAILTTQTYRDMNVIKTTAYYLRMSVERDALCCGDSQPASWELYNNWLDSYIFDCYYLLLLLLLFYLDLNLKVKELAGFIPLYSWTNIFKDSMQRKQYFRKIFSRFSSVHSNFILFIHKFCKVPNPECKRCTIIYTRIKGTMEDF